MEVWERDDARDTARKLKTVKCHDAACRTLSFVNDGALLLTGSSDRSILATDVASGQPLARLTNAHKSAVNRLIAIDANTIASGDDDGVVKVWDTRQQKACGQFSPFVDFVSDICHVPMGAGAGENAPQQPGVDPSAPGTSAAGAAQGVGAHPGTLVVTSGDGTVGHLSLHNWKVLGQSDTLDDELLSACVVKNGKKVIAGSQTGTLNVFDYGKWEEYTDRFPGHPNSIDSIIKVDEDTVLTGSSDGIVRIISILPNKMLGVVGEHGDMPVERMALSRDRTVLATASHDHTIKLWDVKYLFDEMGVRGRLEGGDEDDEIRAELGGSAADSDSDDSDDSDDGGKRKRKKKESGKKSKMQGSGEARAVAKKQAAKKFFDGL